VSKDFSFGDGVIMSKVSKILRAVALALSGTDAFVPMAEPLVSSFCS
jgi:hypothetical protein